MREPVPTLPPVQRLIGPLVPPPAAPEPIPALVTVQRLVGPLVDHVAEERAWQRSRKRMNRP